MSITLSRRAMLAGTAASVAAAVSPALGDAGPALPIGGADRIDQLENAYERVRRLQRELSDALADLIADGGPDYVSVVAAAGTGRHTRATIDRDVYENGPHGWIISQT